MSRRDNKEERKNRVIALLVTVAVHTVAVVLLLFLFLKSSIPQPGGGILVDIGDMPLASGMFMPHQLEPDYQPTSPEPFPEPSDSRLLTQDSSNAPEVKTSQVDKRKEEEQRRLEQKRLEQKWLEQKRIEDQRRRDADEAKRREAIRKNVAGAFGNTHKSGSGDASDAPSGKVGSPQGNVGSGGATAGVGGFGSFSLSGRGLAPGTALQRPTYNVQEEGVIVISITVNPEGKVIQTLIGPGTTIGNTTLRKSALQAAKTTRFNAVEGLNNQTGTITYRFQLN